MIRKWIISWCKENTLANWTERKELKDRGWIRKDVASEIIIKNMKKKEGKGNCMKGKRKLLQENTLTNWTEKGRKVGDELRKMLWNDNKKVKKKEERIIIWRIKKDVSRKYIS